MNLRYTLTLGLSLLLSATLFSGCGKDRRTPPTSGSTTQIATATSGTVAALTGDDDSEVSAATQLLVSQAVLLDENDAPLEF
jgi:hypothetical protein